MITWRNTVTALLICAMVLLGGVFMMCLILLNRASPVLTPQQAYEEHLVALDEGDLVTAGEFLGVQCPPIDPAAIDGLREFLHERGLTWTTALTVTSVWRDGQGQAILSIIANQQRQILYMERIDGRWVMACAGFTGDGR